MHSNCIILYIYIARASFYEIVVRTFGKTQSVPRRGVTRLMLAINILNSP